MARYIGPKSKIARRFGEPIFGADKVLSKRNFPPGQHGNNRRRKMSEYGVMLAEKQKAKYTYGVLERQFRNMFDKAAKADGITGEVLLQNLECRLDNVVFRLYPNAFFRDILLTNCFPWNSLMNGHKNKRKKRKREKVLWRIQREAAFLCGFRLMSSGF